MSFHQLNESCYYYHSSVNIGYVNKGTTGLLIDSGIDSSSVKKVLKELKKRELPLTHLFITHAHADHYGGASFLQEHFDVYTVAPVFEEAILRNPTLEPLYLFGGNDPLPELHNKFLEGPRVRIDKVVDEGEISFESILATAIHLPGHSYHQLALKIDGILYAADSYFSEETLKKHRIPFLTDVSMTLDSLDQLLTLTYRGSVPGHGIFEENPKVTIQKNIDYHEQLSAWLHQYLVEAGTVSQETVIAAMCKHYGIQSPPLSQWLLFRTAVTAYLLGLKKAGLLEDRIIHYKWCFSIID
ncbi:Glyoxylase, beta-lactamase superfamily II [Halobacillus karajensis]|uniref:Hydroxyacylglutathione hydrolase n=1 Tax=Halobacillus karajensis TaxID=195088 RepID=A0A024P883_9BACI|nr:MBL fold metallo-hydrolase [Halobacillus karajensis]CDQ21000.1 hydroxyacylglutathione hydrolase [Halobacillus karajensis]CDQ24936.1 hydroxyacylglutathione hydrolase [Halobacillus karajensis]CDQ28703.1 hydroxyacylglutathione hydrolase [Halobacillus karajensis]SEH97681.1 Glyoxylase, beta-lactamase superfamily II [Halobacillus karajensis]